MKRLFYLSLLLAVYFLIAVANNIVTDMDRLTRYGWGYVTGQAVLFLIFSLISYFFFIRAFKKRPVA